MLDEIAAGETALQRAERATWFIELCAQAQGQMAQVDSSPSGSSAGLVGAWRGSPERSA